MTKVDSYRESTEIDSTQVLESTRVIVTSFVSYCSSCTRICYLGNPLKCNVIGYHGIPLSFTVERDFSEVIDLSSWIMITT